MSLVGDKRFQCFLTYFLCLSEKKWFYVNAFSFHLGSFWGQRYRHLYLIIVILDSCRSNYSCCRTKVRTKTWGSKIKGSCCHHHRRFLCHHRLEEEIKELWSVPSDSQTIVYGMTSKATNDNDNDNADDGIIVSSAAKGKNHHGGYY